MTIIVKTIHGSHLYGLNTPASDMDYKSVYFPSWKELLLQGPRGNKVLTTGSNATRNGAEDIDDTAYSVVSFFDLLKRSEMIAMDMIHTPCDMLITKSDYWFDLTFYKEYFYCKNMKSYVGYIRKQVAKYGVKGSRVAALQKAVEYLQSCNIWDRMEEHLHKVPVDDEFLFVKEYFVDQNIGNMLHYDVLGARYSTRTKIEHVLPSLENKLKEYGKRAILAMQNDSVDWKAVSHAFRACYQLQDLFENNTMTLPLREDQRKSVLEIKLGQVPWSEAQNLLELQIEKTHDLSQKANLPENIDLRKIDDWCYYICDTYYKENL